MHYTQVQPDVAHWSIVGWLIDVTLLREIDVGMPKDAPRGLVAARDSGGGVLRHDSCESVPPRDHWPA